MWTRVGLVVKSNFYKFTVHFLHPFSIYFLLFTLFFMPPSYFYRSIAISWCVYPPNINVFKDKRFYKLNTNFEYHNSHLFFVWSHLVNILKSMNGISGFPMLGITKKTNVKQERKRWKICTLNILQVPKNKKKAMKETKFKTQKVEYYEEWRARQ